MNKKRTTPGAEAPGFTDPATQEAKPLPRVKIVSGQQLMDLINGTMRLEIKLEGVVYELEVRRLKGETVDQVKEIMAGATPPYVPERKDYDLMNPAYQRELRMRERWVQSFIAYTCCPALAQMQPGLTNPQAIHKFVSSTWCEELVRLIAATATEGGMSAEIQARANFTSMPGSEN